MPDPLNLPERKDADGEWHQVVRDVCYWCGCHYLHAEDDRDLVWEPGKDREKACSDDECECHTAPLVGGTATERVVAGRLLRLGEFPQGHQVGRRRAGPCLPRR